MSAAGLAQLYEGLIDGLVVRRADRPGPSPRCRPNLLMDGPAGRRRLPRETLDFALTLVPRAPTE